MTPGLAALIAADLDRIEVGLDELQPSGRDRRRAVDKALDDFEEVESLRPHRPDVYWVTPARHPSEPPRFLQITGEEDGRFLRVFTPLASPGAAPIRSQSRPWRRMESRFADGDVW